MKAYRLAAVILLLGPLAARAEMPPMPSPIQAKADLEQKIVDEVSGILDRFLGPGRAHVTVFLNVEIKSPEDNANPKKAEKKDKNVESKWMWREISKKPKMSVLPGFAVNPDVTVTDNKKAEPKPDVPPQPDDSDMPAYEIEVKRMLVSIVLDSSISDKNEKMIEVMVSEVLGLDPDRGDRLNIYKLPLQPAWKWALETPENLLRVFWGVIGLLTLAILLFFVTRSVQAVNQARSLLPERPKEGEDSEHEHSERESTHDQIGKEGAAAAGAGAAHDGAAAAGGAGGGTTEEQAIVKQILDFVSLDNFEMLSELLKDSDPKEVACLLGFVDPILSSRILDQLSQEKRIETMMYLVSATSIPPQELAEIRRGWRERLAFAYGGTGAVGELLSTMDPAMQKMFLDRLKMVSPELAPKVSGALIRMDDLARLEASDLAQLTQAVSFEDWAKALAPLAPSYKERVLAVLPDSSRQVLQQWLTLTKPKKLDIQQSQHKVLATMRSLIRQGKIVLTQEPVPGPRLAPPMGANGKPLPAPAPGPVPAVGAVLTPTVKPGPLPAAPKPGLPPAAKPVLPPAAPPKPRE